MADKHYPWDEAFLAALREYPVLSHAAEACGIDRSTAWRRMQRDKEFADAVQLAMEAGVDRAEQEAFRRGVHGYHEPVIDKGRLAYVYERVVGEDGAETYRPVLDDKGQPIPLTVRKHSDALLALVLKARRKAYSTERTELTSPDGSMSPIDDSTRATRLAQIAAAARARRAAGGAEPDDFSDLA